MSTVTRILLIRHGQSTWNAEGRWQGAADPPLSPLGVEQARHAARRLATLGQLDGVGSSALRRALHTADLLAEGAGVLRLGAFDGLNERHAGDWEGLTRAEIDEGYPGWLDEGRRPDGYEHDAEVIARATIAIRSVVNEHRGATIAVVSHGGLIGNVERVDGEPWRRFANLEARWFEVTDAAITPVGDRVHLLAEDEETSPPTPQDYA